jgi:hypothetical protein
MRGYRILIVHDSSNCSICEKVVGSIVTLSIEYVGNSSRVYGEGENVEFQ